MVEETLTVGDTEVVVRETADGFEVEEHSPDVGSIEKFKSDTGVENGDSIRYGSIDEIRSAGYNNVEVYVNNNTHDEMWSDFFDQIHDTPWRVVEVDFDNGHVTFEDTDEE